MKFIFLKFLCRIQFLEPFASQIFQAYIWTIALENTQQQISMGVFLKMVICCPWDLQWQSCSYNYGSWCTLLNVRSSLSHYKSHGAWILSWRNYITITLLRVHELQTFNGVHNLDVNQLGKSLVSTCCLVFSSRAWHFLFAQSGCFKFVSTKLVNMGKTYIIDNSLPCDWRSTFFDDWSIYVRVCINIRLLPTNRRFPLISLWKHISRDNPMFRCQAHEINLGKTWTIYTTCD